LKKVTPIKNSKLGEGAGINAVRHAVCKERGTKPGERLLGGWQGYEGKAIKPGGGGGGGGGGRIKKRP